MKRKVWALMLTVAMIATTVPMIAFADTAQTNEQIGAYFEVNDETGVLPDAPKAGFTSGTEQSYEDGKVKVNKTITATEVENVFDIELEVSTQEEIDKASSSPDAATVIVIDCSGSMTSSRMASAKKAAQTFINSFVDENAERKIAIVRYSGSKNTAGYDGANTVQPWINASELKTASNEIYCTPINGLRAGGATNTEAGLMLGRNLLKQLEADPELGKIENKNIILLTDGKPTLGVLDSAESKYETEVTTICPKDYRGYSIDDEGAGDATSCSTHEDVETMTAALKTSGYGTYAVYLGNDIVNCSSWNCDLNKTGAKWLAEDCGFTTYSAEDSDLEKLISIFEKIVDLIKKKSQAWIVTDPMGTNINFEQFITESSLVNEFVENDGTITWDIKQSPRGEESTSGNVTTTTYKLKYRVKLDTLAKGYKAETYYATNGKTQSTYLITETENGVITDYTNGTAYFNIPSVKGYAGKFTFNKVNNFGEALEGAEFKLTHKNGCCDDVQAEDAAWATAKSDANGVVSFANVPSGHKYILTETTAPEGYVKDSKEYEVAVSYGKVTVTGMTDNKVVNDPVTTDIVVAKNVTGTLGDVNKEFQFTAKAVDKDGRVYTVESGEGYTVSDENVIEFTLKHGESVTIKGVPVGATLQIEETNALGYDKTMTAVDTKGTETADDDTAVKVTGSGDSGSVTVAENLKVTVNNDKNPIVDTGIYDNMHPYLIIFLIAAIAAVSGILYKTRRREA